MKKGKLIKNVFTFVLLVICLVIIWKQLSPYSADLKRVGEYRNEVSYTWIIAAFFVQTMQYVIEGFFFKSLFGKLGYALPLSKTIRISALDVFAIRLIPLGELGSLATFVYFYRKLGVKIQSVLYLNVILSIIRFTLLAILLLASAAILHERIVVFGFSHPFLGLFGGTVVLVFLVSILLYFHAGLRQRALQGISKLPGYQIFQKKVKKFQELNKIFVRQRKAIIVQEIMMCAIYFACDIFIVVSCLAAFSEPINVPLAAFSYITATIAATVSMLPGGFGATDTAFTVIFLSFHIPPVIAIGVVILYRLVSFVFPLILGLFAFFSLRWELNGKNGRNVGIKKV